MDSCSILKEYTVKELVKDKKDIIDVSENTTLENALHKMQENNVMCLPVYKENSDKSRKYIGIISNLEIISYISFADYFKSSNDITNNNNNEEPNFNLLKFDQVFVGEILGKIELESSELWTATPDMTLYRLAEYFSKGIHRALVLGCHEQQKPKLVTQTDLVTFLSCHEDAFEQVFNKRIEELKLVNPLNTTFDSVFHLKTSDSALQGFKLMERHEVRALPVVNEAGELITTFSVTDTRHLSATTLDRVLQPVEQYLRQESGNDRVTHPLTCTSADPLGSIVIKMKAAKHHKHQVWVVNAAFNPIGCVSMTDVIKSIYNY